jgi:hypothetical protein
MTKTIILHNQDNLPTAKYTDFIDLQGNLKTLPKEKQEKLKNSIIKYGIRFPAFIWQSQDKKYIVDAHQRKKVFAILEKEGWAVPEVSYTNIVAKNEKEAAELSLQANSRYGEINPETTFFKDFDIGLEFMEEIEIPELELNLEDVGEEIIEGRRWAICGCVVFIGCSVAIARKQRMWGGLWVAIKRNCVLLLLLTGLAKTTRKKQL